MATYYNPMDMLMSHRVNSAMIRQIEIQTRTEEVRDLHERLAEARRLYGDGDPITEELEERIKVALLA